MHTEEVHIIVNLASSRCTEKSLVYCYLMQNLKKRSKTHTYVGKARCPSERVQRHNRGTVRNVKSTRSACGHWILDMVIGPFLSKEEALRFRSEWKKNFRGIESRRKHGVIMAEERELLCWDRNATAESS